MHKSWGTYILLHLILLLYSAGGIFSKLASGEPFFSLKFCLYYGGVLLMLMVYAFLWQQIIKRLPLSTAFANKAVTVVWGMVFGMLVFHEQITAGKVIGAIIVICGVVLYAISDREEARDDG